LIFCQADGGSAQCQNCKQKEDEPQTAHGRPPVCADQSIRCAGDNWRWRTQRRRGPANHKIWRRHRPLPATWEHDPGAPTTLRTQTSTTP
jgi:hypothetical protein